VPLKNLAPPSELHRFDSFLKRTEEETVPSFRSQMPPYFHSDPTAPEIRSPTDRIEILACNFRAGRPATRLCKARERPIPRSLVKSRRNMRCSPGVGEPATQHAGRRMRLGRADDFASSSEQRRENLREAFEDWCAFPHAGFATDLQCRRFVSANRFGSNCESWQISC
jgi:hypothetical protein